MLRLATSRFSCFASGPARVTAFNAAPKAQGFAMGSVSSVASQPSAPQAAFSFRSKAQPAVPAKPLSARSPGVMPSDKSTHDKDNKRTVDSKIRYFKDGSLAVETTCGKVLEMHRIDREMTEKLARKPAPHKRLADGSDKQLIRLDSSSPIARHVITDPATSQAYLHRYNVDQGLHLEASLCPLDQLAKVPTSGKLQYITVEQANQRSLDAGRSPEWQGQIVPISTVPTGTILIQIATDAFPLNKVGENLKSRDSQAYQIAKAIYQEEAGPLGSYFLVSAPGSAGEAAMYAAILDQWKQGCTHFTVVIVIRPFPALFGQIKGQQGDAFVDPATGTIGYRNLEGGVLQCNPVNPDDISSCVRVLHLHQLFDLDDKEMVSRILNSGLQGGALVQEMIAYAHKQDLHGAFGD